jgi:phosphomannomutase
MSIFKAYDIRGVYGHDFDLDTVYKIGYFIPKVLKADAVWIGRDMRNSSEEISKVLIQGITDAGADAYDMGLCSTSSVYFATVYHDAKASVQITASHNPKDHNGFKISREHAISVGGDDGGIQKIEQLVQNEKVVVSSRKGNIIHHDIRDEYMALLNKYVGDFHHLRVAIDGCHGMANLYIKELMSLSGAHVSYICDTMDGNFPLHDPNPLDEKNCRMLQDLVIADKSDIGLIYDGDADRVMIIDEKGRFVRPDIVTAILAEPILQKEQGKVVVDIRTSRAVIEAIQSMGAEVIMWRVGHAYATLKLAQTQAILGGELAGHYYFRDFYNNDCGILASLFILQRVNKLKKEGILLSDLVDKIDCYHNSGEMNFVIENKDAAMQALKIYAEQVGDIQAVLDFDGLRFEFSQWWFNVRKSNTEPYLRLIIEAETDVVYKKHYDAIIAIMKTFEGR